MFRQFAIPSLAVVLTVAMGASLYAQNNNALKKEFKKPGLEYRMNVNRHSMPHDPAAQDSMIHWIVANGYGGMATNVNPNGYLRNEQEWAVFNRFALASKAKGLDLWIYDEKLYPSGMADTLILSEHPEWEAEGLFMKDTTVVGGGSLRWTLIPGEVVLLQGVPYEGDSLRYDRAVDLSNAVRDRTIEWKVPAGRWALLQATSSVLYHGFQSGTERGGVYPRYTSLLMPEVTHRFIELTHKQYAAHFKQKLGDIFTSTFTDEPSSMALPFAQFSYGVYPWKQNVSAEFLQRSGMSLTAVLPRIMLDTTATGNQLRYTYFKIISDFMSNHYFRQIREYCASQKLRSGGHLLLEESMMAHVPLYGSIMACYRQMDVPGIDVLTGLPSLTRRYLYSSRLAASASELNGGTMVMTESCPIAEYSIFNGKEAPSVAVRGSLNRQIVGGVTDFNNYLQLQHEDSTGRTLFNDYIARVEMLLSGGVRASRIAVLYPIETMWSHYRPQPIQLVGWDSVAHGDDGAQHLTQLFDRVSDCLYDNGWEFSYIDMAGLEESKVTNKSLTHGALQWDVLILPGVETLSDEALKRVSEFGRAGGCVIFLEQKPYNRPNAFGAADTKKSVDRLISSKEIYPMVYFEPRFDARLMNLMLEGVLERDMLLNNYHGVLTSHKRIGGKQVYFIVNDTDAAKSLTANFPGIKSLELWRPLSGEVKQFGTEGLISLAPYEGVVIRESKVPKTK